MNLHDVKFGMPYIHADGRIVRVVACDYCDGASLIMEVAETDGDIWSGLLFRGEACHLEPCHRELWERRFPDGLAWDDACDGAESVSGVDIIAIERHGHITREGWSASHDDMVNGRGELIDAASSYIRAAINVGHPAMSNPPQEWPWARQWWKPSRDIIRNLAKAGALIAAEIDRLRRAGVKGGER